MEPITSETPGVNFNLQHTLSKFRQKTVEDFAPSDMGIFYFRHL